MIFDKKIRIFFFFLNFQAEEKRQKELAKAKESYERWLQEKDLERKRINEVKRLEKEEEEVLENFLIIEFNLFDWF